MTNVSHFKRVIEELCEAFGLKDAGPILRGGKLQVDDFFLTFIHDENYRADRMYVYLDMGETGDRDPAKVYKALLKLNFEMEGGERGSMCIHPENEHLFYSFFYVLDEKASGAHLLNTLMKFVAQAGVDGLNQPQDAREVKTLATAAKGRAQMSRLMQGR